MRRELWNSLKEKKFTDFQIKVLEETCRIPRGKVATYQDIARRIGYPRAYRAVGTALRKNPHPIVIPCHRVIKLDGTPGQYAGGDSKRKISLLRKEGYRFV